MGAVTPENVTHGLGACGGVTSMTFTSRFVAVHVYFEKKKLKSVFHLIRSTDR
jgi:hypothetical protein